MQLKLWDPILNQPKRENFWGDTKKHCPPKQLKTGRNQNHFGRHFVFILNIKVLKIRFGRVREGPAATFGSILAVRVFILDRCFDMFSKTRRRDKNWKSACEPINYILKAPFVFSVFSFVSMKQITTKTKALQCFHRKSEPNQAKIEEMIPSGVDPKQNCVFNLN